MKRGLLIIIFGLVLVACFAWWSAQTLPNWYSAENTAQQRAADGLSQRIQEQGVGRFLASKFAGVLNGQLELSEAEFNGVLLASLRASQDGKRLLAVSDDIHVDLSKDQLEVGVVVDLEKLAHLDAKNRQRVEKLKEALPLLTGSKLFLAVSGQPIVRDGGIAFSEDFSVKVGALPLSSDLLARVGAPIHKAKARKLELKYLTVHSISVEQERIILGVYPRL